MRPRERILLALVGVQLVIFVLSLPGLGIETRSASQYAAWAAPIFLGLTALVFALGVAAIAVARRRMPVAARLAVAQAGAALVTNVLDISHVGGPPPPTGPLILAIVSIAVAVGEIVYAGQVLKYRPAPASTEPAAPSK